ncbi:NUDIX hydrolase [Thermoflexus sp.]|jgi:8-oxo-dGTP pyrophosphatase MutT (NUDIX family)|uniref:NUDIX hydrolase n=1 Tax=Thermoflexus sp. TaxID=1969742 RepID=UPI003C0802C0
MTSSIRTEPTPEAMIQRLQEALARPLPGPSAQWEMAPPYRRALLEQTGGLPPEARPAAVLILLYPRGRDLAFPLTRRTDHVAHHKGQISLPGGACEPGESPEAAALRETEEELGFLTSAVGLLGHLTPLYVPPSGFLVYPVVGYLPERPVFHPAPLEVAEVLEATLSWLLDPRHQGEEEWELHGARWRIPVFRLGGHVIWGATAMILAEFRAVAREALDPLRGSHAGARDLARPSGGLVDPAGLGENPQREERTT